MNDCSKLWNYLYAFTVVFDAIPVAILIFFAGCKVSTLAICISAFESLNYLATWPLTNDFAF